MKHVFSYMMWTLGLVCCVALVGTQAEAQDVVEFLSGSRLEGDVTAIRKGEKEFDFSARISNRVTSRTFSFEQVHAVILNGKRHVLTPLPSPEPTSDAASTQHAGNSAVMRSPAEINRIIEEAGRTPPDWYESVTLEYPDTLDLQWPLRPPEKAWDNQKNMGQYIWDVINPNPRQWRSGIKLVHHCMTLHTDQPTLLNRDMQTLGTMYFQLLQDYPRAAFWLRKVDQPTTPRNRVLLAECYWRLGSRKMALQTLDTNQLPIQAIKLLGDLGQTQRAVQLAMGASASPHAAEAFLMAGDTMRQAGRQAQAIEFYQRVLDTKKHRNKEYEERHKARARESMEAVKLFDQLKISEIKDGTYTGIRTGYNGPMTIEVEVRNGRIDSIKVTSHQEKQFYSAIEETPRRIIERQGLEVDGVSGATITSQAIVNATASALAKGNQ